MAFNREALQLDRFRNYLQLLASLHVDPGLQGKLDISGIVQVTLWEAFKGCDQFRGADEKALAMWLRQILMRNLVDELRKLKRAKHGVVLEKSLHDSTVGIEAWLAADHSSPSEQADRNEQLIRLADALQQLPADQRLAVVRHHLEGAPLAKVAGELQRSKVAVAGLLHRGMTRLRDLLRDDSANHVLPRVTATSADPSLAKSNSIPSRRPHERMPRPG